MGRDWAETSHLQFKWIAIRIVNEDSMSVRGLKVLFEVVEASTIDDNDDRWN